MFLKLVYFHRKSRDQFSPHTEQSGLDSTMQTAVRNVKAFTGLLDSLVPSLVRSLQTKATIRPVPPPTGDAWSQQPDVRKLTAVSRVILIDPISTPKDFLTAIGRSSEKKLSFNTWEALWNVSRYEMKKAGVSVRDRR